MVDKVKVNEPFSPDSDLKNLYRLYASPLLAVFIIVSLVCFYFVSSGDTLLGPIVAWIIVLVPTAFVYYWISKYYESISFELTDNEVIVEKGVWFQKSHNVPYRLIMNVNTSQGPISRRFGIGSANIETAGHSGQKRGPEASIFGVENFVEIKDKIIGIIRGKESFQAGEERREEEPVELNSEILEEIREIRKILEKSEL